jgi:hypothetical protein
MRVGNAPVGSLISAVVAGAVVAFLGVVGPASAGGGEVPIGAVLLMALPIWGFSLCALGCDLDARRPSRIRIDRKWVRVQAESSETAIPTAEVTAVVAVAWGVMVEGGSGVCPLMLPAPDAEFVRARVERALAWAREPQAYR